MACLQVSTMLYSYSILQEEKLGGQEEAVSQKFGEGYAHTVDCSDSDSDDDLVPCAMDDDYDSTQPRYLRTLMQGMYVCVST